MRHRTIFKILIGSFLIIISFIGCFFVYVIVDLSKPFHGDIYQDLLLKLRGDGYEFLRYGDFLKGNNKSLKVCVLVHDVDGFGYGLNGVHILRNVELDLDVKSTFFIRVDHDYFPSSITLFQDLEHEGWEIGFHYSSLSRTGNMTLALRLFEAQLNYLRAFFNISSIRAHGDRYNINIDNGLIWKEQKAFCQSLGVQSILHFDTYIRDTNKKIVIPNVKEWGNVILLNFHADWW